MEGRRGQHVGRIRLMVLEECLEITKNVGDLVLACQIASSDKRGIAERDYLHPRELLEGLKVEFGYESAADESDSGLLTDLFGHENKLSARAREWIWGKRIDESRIRVIGKFREGLGSCRQER